MMRFSDTLAADAVDLNFEYIIRVSLYRRHVYAGRPTVRSSILATDSTLIHYGKVHALLTQGSPINVRVFHDSMKTITKFLMVTLVGGLLVVLPVWVSLLLLLKAIKGAMAMLMPIAKLLPQWFVHEKVAALMLLLAICFAVGLLIRTRAGQRLGHWLAGHIFDRIPGFSLMRGITRQLAGKKGEQAFQPALVEIEDALVPAFIIEKHADGQFTVFVSSSPTPMAGAIYILQPERVHPVDVPLRKAMMCVTRWGAGAAELRAAIHPASMEEGTK